MNLNIASGHGELIVHHIHCLTIGRIAHLPCTVEAVSFIGGGGQGYLSTHGSRLSRIGTDRTVCRLNQSNVVCIDCPLGIKGRIAHGCGGDNGNRVTGKLGIVVPALEGVVEIFHIRCRRKSNAFAVNISVRGEVIGRPRTLVQLIANVVNLRGKVCNQSGIFGHCEGVNCVRGHFCVRIFNPASELIARGRNCRQCNFSTGRLCEHPVSRTVH